MDNYQYYISRLVEILQDNHRGMTISELASGLGMSRNTIGKYLEIMYLSGMVDTRSVGKAKLYFLSSRIPVTRLLSYITTSVIQTDDQYRIRSINISAADLLGSFEEELVGRNILDLLSMQGLKADVRSRILNTDRQNAFTADIELNRGEGRRLFWMTIADVVMYDGAMGHVFLFEDVHEWKEAEELKNRYKTIFCALANEYEGMVFILNSDLVFTYVNPYYGKIAGKDPASLVGDTFSAYADTRTHLHMKSAVGHVISKGEPFRSIMQVQKQTDLHWFDERLFPVMNNNGEVKEVLGVVRDITGFQEGGSAPVLLKVLSEFLHEAVITTTPNGTVISWNRGAELMTGYPADELVGGSALTIITPDLNEGRDLIRETVSGEDIRDLKAIIRARGGRKKKVFLSTSRLSVQGDIVSGVAIVIREH